MSIKPVRGLRSYYPTDKGPIDTYQLGRNGRVEYLAAEIATDHLSKGNDTTDEWKKWAREHGVSSDEPGLILSHRLGGTGTDKANLFPKSPLLEKTVWAEHEKAAAEEASEMKKWKKIKFSARLDYPSDDSTRPSAIEYQYDLPSGTILYGKVRNDAAPAEAAEEEAEEESEYEEEEEVEESEEEAEETVAENKVKPAEEPVQSEEEEEEAEIETTAPSAENTAIKATPPQEPVKVPEAPVVQTVVQPPTPPVIEIQKSPSPPPPPPPQVPNHPTPAAAPVTKPQEVPPAKHDDSWTKASPPKTTKPTNESKQQSGGVVTKSDLIDLIPVIGSCKLAVETAQAVFNGNGRLAIRKAVQCGISLVADFYLGRAIARHGRILASSVTEQAVIRFVTKAENQIIIVSAFKATNQLLNTLTRTLF